MAEQRPDDTESRFMDIIDAIELDLSEALQYFSDLHRHNLAEIESLYQKLRWREMDETQIVFDNVIDNEGEVIEQLASSVIAEHGSNSATAKMLAKVINENHESRNGVFNKLMYFQEKIDLPESADVENWLNIIMTQTEIEDEQKADQIARQIAREYLRYYDDNTQTLNKYLAATIAENE